jgi:hypothetical protein
MPAQHAQYPKNVSLLENVPKAMTQETRILFLYGSSKRQFKFKQKWFYI